MKPCPSPTCRVPMNPTEVRARDNVFWVQCHNCDMRGPLGDSPDMALEFWDELPRHDAWARRVRRLTEGIRIRRVLNNWPALEGLVVQLEAMCNEVPSG